MTSENRSTNDASQVSMTDIQLMLGDKDLVILNLQKRIMVLQVELQEKQTVIDNLTAAGELVNTED